MRVDTLHRRIANDVRVMHDAVDEVLPAEMPAQYHGRSVNMRTLLGNLNEVTEPFNIHNVLRFDTNTKPGRVQNSAWWYPEDMLPKYGSTADIHVHWHVYPGIYKIGFTQALWNRKRLYFWLFAMHELIHRHQNANRELRDIQDSRKYRAVSTDRETRKNQKYLGDYDEIEAFAFQAAAEMRVWWPTLSLQDAVSETLKREGSIADPTYPFYIRTFDDAPNHPALAAFSRKLRVWHDVIGKNLDLYKQTLHL